ncbi:MAG: glycine zipper 2TM domain-containing protein [Candidatus Sedimenticola sp. 20ELBAFRAG]
MMKKTAALITIGLMSVSITGYADNSFSDRARVLKAKPIYETVQVSQPEEQCWSERVYHRGERRSKSYTPSIAGAIIGGAIGNQFGKGTGKKIMTVAGAALGASVGNDISKKGHRRGYATTERRCEVVDRYTEQEELVGYKVKYKYNGKTFWTRTDNHPGKWLDVSVSVSPAYRRY